MNTFTILVDTNCDLPPELMLEHGIEAIPTPFDLDGVKHDLGYWQEITPKEYYDALRNGSVAKTSQINPGTFIELFTKYAEQKKDLLYIALSSGLSNTYQNSIMAAQQIRETHPDSNIYPLDSISASVGQGLLAMLAVQKRKEGLTAQETAAWLEQKKHSCFGFFTVDDLMYLHRGGRLSKLSAVAGSVLSIKPVLNFAPDGTLALKDKARGRRPSLALMAEQFKRSVAPNTAIDTIYISHTDCEADAMMLAGMIKESFEVRQVIVMVMGPIVGAHVGPGTVTLLAEAGMTRDEYENKFYKKNKN